MAVIKDLTGQRFGRLVALKYVGKTNNGNAKWECQCDCGNIAVVASYCLRSGQTRSCGCLAKERHEAGTHGQTKGGKHSRLYRIWSGMKTRCFNPNQQYAYGKYGAKGITMCNEWRNSFESFMKWAIDNGYNDTLTIDRINPYGAYCPENCRWATQTEQQNNRSNNRRITFDGETHTLAEWAKIKGLSRSALTHRLDRGWPIERIMTTPQMQ